MFGFRVNGFCNRSNTIAADFQILDSKRQHYADFCTQNDNLMGEFASLLQILIFRKKKDNKPNCEDAEIGIMCHG